MPALPQQPVHDACSTLWPNGKGERSHRIDAEEFYRMLDGVVIDDAKVFDEKLRRRVVFVV